MLEEALSSDLFAAGNGVGSLLLRALTAGRVEAGMVVVSSTEVDVLSSMAVSLFLRAMTLEGVPFMTFGVSCFPGVGADETRLCA
jgi:hypothetical protein